MWRLAVACEKISREFSVIIGGWRVGKLRGVEYVSAGAVLFSRKRPHPQNAWRVELASWLLGEAPRQEVEEEHQMISSKRDEAVRA